MKNTTDPDKELEEFLKNAGIELNAREKELLKRCSGYADHLIDRGTSSWPIGVPLIRKPAVKPVGRSFDDIAATVWKNRRNSFTPKPKQVGGRNAAEKIA